MCKKLTCQSVAGHKMYQLQRVLEVESDPPLLLPAAPEQRSCGRETQGRWHYVVDHWGKREQSAGLSQYNVINMRLSTLDL